MTLMEIIPKATQDAVTFALALLGAVLGVVNVWRAISRDRIKVRVSPQWYGSLATDDTGVCLEVVNLGYFPITISKVGFTTSTADKEISYPGTFFLNGESFPHRLEPRAAITAFIPAGAEHDEVFAFVRSAFVKTACGKVFTGSSKVLRHHVKAARASK